ncbi:MAG: DUF2169 domain-containing protein [Tabrizicola sp.]|jgi:hypothetical protein|nr:DUF2169 domain-containing protein [Tabrizicola sp.]
MRLLCDYPLATLFFRHWDVKTDNEVGVVIAKARFQRPDGGRFRLDPAAPTLVLADVFEGDPAVTPLHNEQDLAPTKPATDVIIRAVARSPRAEALSDWSVQVIIPDRLAYDFRVRGPVEWRKTRGTWGMTRAELVTEVPISYGLAYGGMVPGLEPDQPPRAFEANPAGLGFATPAFLSQVTAFAAPQIGDVADFMQSDPLQEMTVQGLGPVAKGWLARRVWAGTFDAHWQAKRHPRMPLDHSPRYWNAAHRRLQLAPKLTGTEAVLVHRISHADRPIQIALPGAGLLLRATSVGGDVSATTMDLRLDLDTVDLDLSAPDPAGHSLLMTWRGQIPAPERFHEARLYGIDVREQE